MRIPYTAAILHQKLGLEKHCMTFDLSQGCSGYTHGLTTNTALMDALGLSDTLLFTCDPYSVIVNTHDRNTALIFGDAASVTHLQRGTRGFALRGTTFGTLPASFSCLTCASELNMDGPAVLRNAVREVPFSIRSLLASKNLDVANVDVFLLHPGSRYVLTALTELLKIEPSRVPFTIADYGNTVSSSLPLMLQPYLQAAKPQRMVLSGFGVGFSWASCLIDSLDREEVA